MSQDTLEITYHVSGFQRAVYVPAPEWPGCRFEQGDNLDVALQITETGLLPDTDVGALIAFADLRIRRLVLAWELRYGRRLKLTRRNTVLPSFPQCEASVEIADSAIVSDRSDAEIARAPPPEHMPQVSLGAERWIRTFAEAGDFPDYAEEQLRRHYLIIEELWDTYAARFNAGDQVKREEIKLIRDFVSHVECNRESHVRFISSHLPSAAVTDGVRPTVLFNRLDVEHRSFVGRYVPDAERIGRALIEHAINDLPAIS